MRFSLLLTALLSITSRTAALAADGAPAKAAAAAKVAAAHKAAAGRRSTAPATAPLKATLVAPTKDVLNEHFAVVVTGTITDANGQPLPGATVWKTNSREVLAVSNSQGDFRVALPTNAPIVLTCGYEGFQEQRLDLRQPRPLNQVVVNLERAAAQHH